MKRGLLGFVALTLAFCFACSPQPATNGNARSSTNAGLNVDSADAGLNVDSTHAGLNVDSAGCNRPSIIHSIVVSLATKPMKDAYFLSVAPYEVTISVKCKDQIRWIVSNPFKEVELKDIQITNFRRLKPTHTDPFGSGPSNFEVKYVAPQRIGDALSGIGVNYGEFEYEVTGKVTLANGTTVPLTLDPRVVVGD